MVDRDRLALPQRPGPGQRQRLPGRAPGGGPRAEGGRQRAEVGRGRDVVGRAVVGHQEPLAAGRVGGRDRRQVDQQRRAGAVGQDQLGRRERARALGAHHQGPAVDGRIEAGDHAAQARRVGQPHRHRPARVQLGRDGARGGGARRVDRPDPGPGQGVGVEAGVGVGRAGGIDPPGLHPARGEGRRRQRDVERVALAQRGRPRPHGAHGQDGAREAGRAGPRRARHVDPQPARARHGRADDERAAVVLGARGAQGAQRRQLGAAGHVDPGRADHERRRAGEVRAVHHVQSLSQAEPERRRPPAEIERRAAGVGQLQRRGRAVGGQRHAPGAHPQVGREAPGRGAEGAARDRGAGGGGEQRPVAEERVEGEAARRRGRAGRHELRRRGRAADRVDREAVHEYAQPVERVAAAGAEGADRHAARGGRDPGRVQRRARAQVERVREGVAGAAQQPQPRVVAQADGQAALGAQVAQVLRPGQPGEELVGLGRPAGDRPGQLAQHLRGALAAAPGDGVPDVEPAALADRPLQQLGADQRAQVGHDPLVAGLDEEVVPEVVEVGAQRGRLAPDHGQEREQRVALLGVVDAVVAGDARVQPRGHVGGVVAAHRSA